MDQQVTPKCLLRHGATLKKKRETEKYKLQTKVILGPDYAGNNICNTECRQRFSPP